MSTPQMTEQASGAHHEATPAVSEGKTTSGVAEITNKTSNMTVTDAKTSTHTHPHEIDELPQYALKYAPFVYLHSDEKFFPGKPDVHIKGLTPCTLSGDTLQVPEEHKGKLSMLGLKDINRPEVFLTLDKNIRKKGGDLIEELMSSDCKPCSTTSKDGHEGENLTANGKSEAPVWILVRDKTGVCGEGHVVDVFYFFFYPYNQGNTVLFTHFGNHIGDWEHAMIRFRNGVPEAMHLSAHSDGNSWKWDAFEKKGDRPVIYAAIGSHANYPNAGTHAYSGVFLVGPTDSTNTGHLWDPALNFVCAKSVVPSSEDPHPCSKYAYLSSSAPGFNKSYSAEDVETVLTFEGRWGNSFSDLRARAKGKSARGSAGHSAEGSTSSSSSDGVGADKTSAGSRSIKSPLAPLSNLYKKLRGKGDLSSGQALRAAEAEAVKGQGPKVLGQVSEGQTEKKPMVDLSMLDIKTKLLILIWAEGPTGPRDKSLERQGMNRWKEGMLDAIGK